MKRFTFFTLLFLFFIIQSAYASTTVFSENGKFGLINDKKEIVAEAKYKKLVRLGEKSFIMQDGSRFGVINEDGEVLVEPKYNQAERVLGKFVKMAKGDKYGIFDEMGFDILPVEYSSIDLLYGGMFVTSKNYMYGITDLNGLVILDNIFDDIYMPTFNKLVLIYDGMQYEIEREMGADMELPIDILNIRDNANIKISDVASNPIATTGYYGVTATDYMLKLISSISPAYEQTIDELMFSQGADTVSVLMRCAWIPKFPFVYAKKYYKNVIDPYNGPLSGIKKTIKRQVKN